MPGPASTLKSLKKRLFPYKTEVISARYSLTPDFEEKLNKIFPEKDYKISVRSRPEGWVHLHTKQNTVAKRSLGDQGWSPTDYCNDPRSYTVRRIWSTDNLAGGSGELADTLRWRRRYTYRSSGSWGNSCVCRRWSKPEGRREYNGILRFGGSTGLQFEKVTDHGLLRNRLRKFFLLSISPSIICEWPQGFSQHCINPIIQ